MTDNRILQLWRSCSQGSVNPDVLICFARAVEREVFNDAADEAERRAKACEALSNEFWAGWWRSLKPWLLARPEKDR